MKIVKSFERALRWIDRYSLPGAGIIVTSKVNCAYLEVSGYFIPTLLSWNEKNRAISYGHWLLTQQHSEGYWMDSRNEQPYVFDTGQIIKGLLALAKSTGDIGWNSSIRRACEWMVSMISEIGEPVVPDVLCWDGKVPLSVLLYSFEAVKRAGEYLNEQGWISKVNSLINWFLQQKGLVEFICLSHFHAYVLEALCDLGLYEYSRQGMEMVAKLQKNSGAVPAYANVNWVCSTGLFQYAVVWYKLGEYKRGDAAFEYATKLQNRSGGWNGSYGWGKKYFPREEISWAVKYFLDALQLKLKSNFENMAPIFSDQIAFDDGRYMLIREEIINSKAMDVLDAGCGKGRYLRNLLVDCKGLSLYGVDLSIEVMKTIPSSIMINQGSLLQLPYADEKFDFVFTVEALEHAVHIDGALRELIRVLKPGGKLVIIDKNVKWRGRLELPDWEQWFDVGDLSQKIKSLGCMVTVRENIAYEGRADGLFMAWIAVKKG